VVVALRGDYKLQIKYNYMESKKSKGLGDSIEKFTKITGINHLAEITAKAIGKKDCGCGKRRDALNKKFPYKK
jgi:hypothetical protein